MLRDAAIVVLEVNIVARNYGYVTVDAHPMNIVFDGMQPKFVDLGSFVVITGKNLGWSAYEEFLRYFYYPLRIWNSGASYIARRIILGAAPISHAEYLRYRYCLVRIMGVTLLSRLVRYYFGYRGLSRFTPELIRARVSHPIGRILAFLRGRNLLPFQDIDLLHLQRRVIRLYRRRCPSQWGRYQESLETESTSFHIPRFNRVLDLISEYGIRTVVELAGNQGVLSRMIIERTQVIRAICTDLDENAVDALYEKSCNQGTRLTGAVLDFIAPLPTIFGSPAPIRFRSDAVIALAVTHHLVLADRHPIERVLSSIGQYAERFVFIEFMPMGLYDGQRTLPIPSWYTRAWFRSHFKRIFDLVLEEQLETNRILFVGRVRAT